jgi:hypothetical protein
MLNCLIVYSIQVKYQIHGFEEILYPYSKTRGNLMNLKIINYRPISILSCLGKLYKPSLQSVAKAFSKSMNAQNIFFFFKVKSSNNEYKENIFVIC